MPVTIPYQSMKMRQTRFDTGIIAGGGETGAELSAQPVFFKKKIESASAVNLYVPANTIILGTYIDKGTVNAGATVQVGKSGSLAAYLAALTALDAYKLAWLTTPVLHSTSDEAVIITPASWTSGIAYLSVICMLPIGRA